MTEIIRQLLVTLADLFITPITDYIFNELGYPIPIIKVGFGSVEWFAMELDLLLSIILGIVLGFILLRLIYRFIKWLFRLGKGLVGVR